LVVRHQLASSDDYIIQALNESCQLTIKYMVKDKLKQIIFFILADFHFRLTIRAIAQYHLLSGLVTF